jgi:uncharacterized protein (DUF2267 family)
VADELPPQFPKDAATTTRDVLELLSQEITPGQMAKVAEALPLSLRALWPKVQTQQGS